MNRPIAIGRFHFEGTLVDFQWQLAAAEAELRRAFAAHGYATAGNYAEMEERGRRKPPCRRAGWRRCGARCIPLTTAGNARRADPLVAAVRGSGTAGPFGRTRRQNVHGQQHRTHGACCCARPFRLRLLAVAGHQSRRRDIHEAARRRGAARAGGTEHAARRGAFRRRQPWMCLPRARSACAWPSSAAASARRPPSPPRRPIS